MGAEETSPAPATPGGGQSASRNAKGTPITPDESHTSEDVDARTPGSPAESEARPTLPVVAPDEAGSSDATPSSPVAPNELEAWLVENVEAERRAAVRGAADGLDDLQGCDLADLEEALELKTWPEAQREKFLDAWRALNKDAMDVDAPAPAASAATTRDALLAAAVAAAPPSTTKKLEVQIEPDAVHVPKPVEKPKRGGHYRSKACEVRRIGDPEWRTFSSRADAARAFPGLTSFDVFNLIEKPRTCKKAVREIYEARNVGGAPPAPAPPPPPRSRYGTRSATPPAASAGPRYGTRAATAPLPREVPSAMEWPRELSEVLRSRAVACTFVSPNPKRARGNTSKSVDAYESYMDATTVDDFFERGGTWAHLKYDVQRGYCTLDAAALKEAWKECGAAPLRRLRSRSLGRVSTRLTTESDRETRFEPADPSQLPAFGAALQDADTLYEKIDIESLVALEAAAVEKSAAVLRRREATLIATRKAGRSNACEVRRVGEEWRRFERQADACRAFPDLSQGDLSRLINNAPDCSPALRLRFEARRVGAASPVPEDTESVTGDVFDDAAAIRAAMEHCVARVAKQDDEPSAAALAWAARQPADSTAAQAISGLGVEMVAAAVHGRRSLMAPDRPAAGETKRRRARLPMAERLRRSGKLVRFVLAPDAPAMTTVAAADGLFVSGRKRPAPVEPLKLPESVLPVRFFETPARADVTVTMDRMVDEVARDTKRPKLAEPVDPAIRATVEFLVAETARPDDVASAASAAWAARHDDDAAAQSISKLGVEMVSTVVHGSARQCGTHWRPAHMYAFLAATRFVDEARARALRDVLLAGRCGDISSSRTRRVVTRLFGDDLRMLERFQHASRKAPPQVRDATVAWYDPESGLDLFPYASCGTAALEWGLTPEIVRDCVEGRTPTANGLYFRRQTSWLIPAGAEMVACGVYRVGDRYRVQLGHDWGFLGNFDSAATAQLVHHDARAKLRRAGLALTAQTASQLARGKAVSLGGCYVLLRRLSSGSDFDVPSMGPTVRDFALRAKAMPFVAFEGSYDAYFVSGEHGRGADGDISIALEEASEPTADSNSLLWWDPVDPSHGVSSRELRTFDIGDGDEYRGIYYRLVRKAYDGSVVFDDEDTSLVQLWCEVAKESDLKKEEDVRVKAWRASLAAGLDGTVRVLSAPKPPSTCLWQRVWARFDAAKGEQNLWGGTVVGYSTKSTRSGQATHLDIVFDDGDRMHMLERDVRKTPPSAVQLEITAPTAKASALIRKILGAAPKRSRSERDVRDEARAARRAARSPMKPRAPTKPRVYGWRAPRLFTADL